MEKILLATGNPHKTEELRRILADLPVELVDLSSFDPPIPEPVEDGDTFLDNAFIKSRYYCRKTGLPAFADDSGLEVDALNGEPGVHSARYAGGDTPHNVKMARVLELLEGVPKEKRTARFRCVAAATFPDGREFHGEGAMNGIIHEKPEGIEGFGYDPILYLPDVQKTSAQISAQEKDARSHRGEAFRSLVSQVFPGPAATSQN